LTANETDELFLVKGQAFYLPDSVKGWRVKDPAKNKAVPGTDGDIDPEKRSKIIIKRLRFTAKDITEEPIVIVNDGIRYCSGRHGGLPLRWANYSVTPFLKIEISR